jgi:hypothetical protein
MREKRSGLPFLLLSTSLSLARLAASQLLRSLAVLFAPTRHTPHSLRPNP